MAERWQQWMPWHIDRFKGSPAVQAMHPAARSGYLYLLGCEWQTDDCSISADAIDLADMSGLGDELWAVYGQRILRNFIVLENGRLQNEVLFTEWREAKRVFEMRQKAAQRTNNHRWSIGDRSVTDQGPNRSADTRTGTGTSTEDQKQKPSRAKKARVADVRHQGCKEAIRAYWESRNSAVEMPWDGSEGKALGMLLSASPDLTAEKTTELLRNRYRSEVNHSDRPSVWLRSLLSYASGPIDRFGKPMNGSTGAANVRSNANLEALRRSIAADEDQDGSDAGGNAAGGQAGSGNNLTLFRTLSARAI